MINLILGIILVVLIVIIADSAKRRYINKHRKNIVNKAIQEFIEEKNDK